MDHETLDWPDLPEISLSDASVRLSAIAESARERAVYLTRRGRPVAVLVSPDVLARLIANAEELADVHAANEACERLDEGSMIGWDDAKRTLGIR